jgi:type IV pilus assembly protein PilB
MLDLKLTTEATIVQALARKLGFEVARLGKLDQTSLDAALKLVGREFAERHNVFPMATDHSTLTVAMADPTNLGIADELRFRFNKRIRVCIGGDREIAEAIRAHYPSTTQQPLEAISLDSEVSGEFLPPLADPFGGGDTDLLEKQMERGPRQAGKRPPCEPGYDVRSELLGSVPRGGFSHRDTAEELELTPLPSSQAPPAAPPVARPTQTGTYPTVASPASAPRQTGTFPTVAPPPATPRQTGTFPPVAPPAAGRTFTPVPRPAPHPIPPPTVTEVLLEEEAVEGRIALRALTPKEVVILDALERLAAGQEDVALPVKPSQVAAALLRIMLRHKIVTQQELLDELLRK